MACPSLEHSAKLVPSGENLSALRACGRGNVNWATGSGCAEDDERSGWRSTTVTLHPAAGATGEVGGGGKDPGVTVA